MDGFNDLTLCVFLNIAALLISLVNFFLIVGLRSRTKPGRRTVERLTPWREP